MPNVRRLVMPLLAVAMVGGGAWATTDLVADLSHDGRRTDDLADVAAHVETASPERVQSTPWRRGVVAGLHEHVNGVIWDGAAFDDEHFRTLLAQLARHDADALVSGLARVGQLMEADRVYAAHDLLAELQQELDG